MTQAIHLTVTVKLHSVTALREVAGVNRHTEIEATLRRMLTNTTRRPEDAGYRIEPETRVTAQGDSQYQLHLHATVLNPERLLQEACSEHQRCWRNDFLQKEPDVATQLFEVVVGSNASPAPVDAGYCIVCWDTVQ